MQTCLVNQDVLNKFAKIIEMKNFLFYSVLTTLFFVQSFNTQAQHTFSIVAVDPVTGEIGSAGATCISGEDGALIISDIVLGIGAIHTQAYYLPANQSNARIRMEAGDSPEEIIDWLIANDANNNPSLRQYGVVDLNNGNPRSAGHTGVNTDDIKIHVTGPNYSIQGNILLSEDVVYDMESAFLATSGTLADKLMAALQGAKRVGADTRCQPFGISSASAFLRVADPMDTDSSYGNLSLDLNVWIESGGEIFEPIDALQDAYDNTLGIEDNFDNSNIIIFPNPTKDNVDIYSGNTLMRSIELMAVTGQRVKKYDFSTPTNYMAFQGGLLESGIYFLRIELENSSYYVSKLIVN